MNGDVTITDSWISDDGILAAQFSNGTFSMIPRPGRELNEMEALEVLTHFRPDDGPFHIWRSKRIPGAIHARPL